MRLSLIISSYNDHDLARELISYLLSQKAPLDECIVIDDASDTAFIPSLHDSCALTVVRNNKNLGPALSKIKGLNTASGDVLLVLDADIRPHTQWLNHALKLLADPLVGAVGSSIPPAYGSTSLSKARHRVFTLPKKNWECSFLPGGALLLKKSIWQSAVNRLEHFPATARSSEDYFLSKTLTQAGFKLIRADVYPVYEIRELHRTGLCGRELSYYKAAVGSIIQKYGLCKFLDDQKKNVAVACGYMETYHDPILFYCALLQTLCLVEKLAHEGVAGRTGELLKAASTLLHNAPQTARLLNRDLSVFDLQLPKIPADTPERSEEIKAFIELFSCAQALEALEHTWVERYEKEDSTTAQSVHHSMKEGSQCKTQEMN